MNKMNCLSIVVAGLILMSGVRQKDNVVQLEDCNLENSVKTVSDKRGTIWFDTQANAYSVFSSIDGNYDSQIIGVPCNLPKQYKAEGVTILFSGNYYKCAAYSPRFPGQEYYYLKLIKINPVSEDKSN